MTFLYRLLLFVALASNFVRPVVAQTSPEAQIPLNHLDTATPNDTCRLIEQAISGASAVAYPKTEQWKGDIKHWASSSTEESACSVEPGTVEDVVKIITILGQQRTSFAIKGGGHTGNKGFSSTAGVHIAMKKFDNIFYDPNTQLVEIGAGAIWDKVYEHLDGKLRHVVGGRVQGVGVGGFTLGGGYSWLSNQYGLTIDTVQAFDIVLPDGTFTAVTSASDPDLFFALRGGGNNFGIVTKFTLRTFPRQQELVWGGFIRWSTEKHVNPIITATVNFCNNQKDPKAAIITNFIKYGGVALTTVNFFYDGPDHKGIFDEFLNITGGVGVTKNVKPRSFLDLVKSAQSDRIDGLRGIFNTGSVLKYSPAVVTQIANQAASILTRHKPPPKFVNYAVESFLPSYFDKSQGGAYPHGSALPVFPLFAHIGWEWKDRDGLFNTEIRNGIQAIVATATGEGQNVSGSNQLQYSNYALPDTGFEMLYGGNVARLRALKKKYDPNNVMGLTGGFKL